MICAICGEREAVVFMRRSAGDAQGELRLCGECARARGLSVGKGQIELRLEDLISEAARAPEAPSLACPGCGSSLESIHAEGRLGCPRCAATFRHELEKFFRARSRPPYYRPGRLSPPSPQAGQAEILARTQVLLDAALRSEDYEEAARLRDKLAALARPGAGDASPGSAAGPQASILSFPAFSAAFPPGADADVVLESRARISRNFDGLPFPRASSPLPAEFASLAAFLAAMPGMVQSRLGTLEAFEREALVEWGIFPRAYSLEPGNAILCSAREPLCALIGEGNALSFATRIPGLAACEGLALLEPAVEAAAAWKPFAFDEDFGYLASRLGDCGSGLSLEASVHLPALSGLGMAERALRGLLARGLALRGIYGGTETSSGELYVVATERAFGQSAPEIAGDFEAALKALAQAERRARAELAAKRRDELLDKAGRALGLIRGCRFLGEAEARSALSALRLAALAACLEGPSPAELGRLMLSLGPGWTALRASSLAGEGGGAGIGGLRGAKKEERLRALSLAESLESGRIKEGGQQCSKA
jgi:protein arginine kinase